MKRKLKWNAIGFQKKTHKLYDELKKELDKVPEGHSREEKKIKGFMEELQNLITKMTEINSELIPKLEITLRLNFPIPEMVLIALTRPSIRTGIENIQTFFEDKENNPLSEDEYRELASTGDAGNVLALIGDAGLDLAVVESMWDSSISTVGKLTEKRRDVVSNQSLAKICDEWLLYDYKLERLPQLSKPKSKLETIEHEKGTLVEAIYGVIYLEFGFEVLLKVVPFIQ